MFAGVAIVVVIGVILAFAGFGTGGGSSASTCPTASGTTAAFDAASAFAIRCAGCHGAGGRGGGIGPKLAGGAVVRDFPNAEDQVKLVCNGRGGMPAFKDRGLTIDQARAIVQYTRTQLQ